MDAQALCAEVGTLLGRCDPALWLLPRRGVAEEAMGGVVLVALALAQVCTYVWMYAIVLSNKQKNLVYDCVTSSAAE